MRVAAQSGDHGTPPEARREAVFALAPGVPPRARMEVLRPTCRRDSGPGGIRRPRVLLRDLLAHDRCADARRVRPDGSAHLRAPPDAPPRPADYAGADDRSAQRSRIR